MEARLHPTTAAFRDVAWPLLSADPITHTIMLTATARDGAAGLLITLHDNERLVGAVVRTEPYPILLSAMPADAVEFTAKLVHDLDPQLPAATGPVELVEPFVAAWTALTGANARRTLASRLFELGQLRPPAVDGLPRRATVDDLPLLTKWYGEFLTETKFDADRGSPDQLAKNTLEPSAASIFWELDGEQVAFAAVRGPVSGMSRVAPVYTPPEHRGHGYGSAATAAASQWALDRGSEHVLLYTDLTNPTTNRIYPAIGYRPLGDSAEYTF